MAKEIKIALAGNPNSGKTTLFNALTGSNQFVGNWPGVTVEKKEGKLKKHNGVTITDLPGIYSLSPYTLEEVVARNYLIDENPDVILNIVDGTNLERNLYLTTQLTELGIPVVMAVNMMDIVNKNGDKIDLDMLSKQMGCKAVAISALKGKDTGHNLGSARHRHLIILIVSVEHHSRIAVHYHSRSGSDLGRTVLIELRCGLNGIVHSVFVNLGGNRLGGGCGGGCGGRCLIRCSGAAGGRHGGGCGRCGGGGRPGGGSGVICGFRLAG